MTIEDEIAKLLMDGKSPTEVIKGGYSKSTVYQVYNKIKEMTPQLPVKEWNWLASATFDKTRYLPEGSGYVDLKLKNTGVTDLFVSQAGVQFDWQSDKWLSTALKLFLSPGEEKSLTRIYFAVPSNISLGNHCYRIGIVTHVWYSSGWLNIGTIWSEDQLLEVKYPKRDYRVFIAHSVKDSNIVYTISRLLDIYGIQSLIAEREFQPGERLSEKVSRMVDSSDCLLAILTKEGKDSQWVNQEIGYGKKAGRRIVPVVEKGVNIKGFIQDIEWIEFDSSDPSKTLQEIVHGMDTEAFKKEQILQLQQQQQAAINALIGFVLLASFLALVGAALSD